MKSLFKKALEKFTSPKREVVSQEEYAHYKAITFEVPVEHCISYYGFGYGANGWHPFVELNKQYLSEPNLTYEESILKKFYDRFNETSAPGIIFGKDNADVASIPLEIVLKLWNSPMLLEKRKYKTLSKNNYLPTLEDDKRKQFQRVISTLTSIQQYGYRPHEFNRSFGAGHKRAVKDGFTRIIMLKNNRDYRCVILGGQHRVAALAALGYEQIPVIFDPFFAFVQIIDLANIDNWPIVAKGICDSSTARKLFTALFQDYGVEKARRMGFTGCQRPYAAQEPSYA